MVEKIVFETETKVRVANSEDVQRGCTVVYAGGHTLALFAVDDKVYAVDNRCPHMGFPLDRGSVRDGILTCHWHHARFDLASGGTFDLFADDVPSYPAWIEDGGVWIDLTPKGDRYATLKTRLRSGLEQQISLVMAKAIVALVDYPDGARDTFRILLDFGAHYHRNGWGMGQTINAVMNNLMPYLDTPTRAQALYQAALSVAGASDGVRFQIDPLPREDVDLPTLKRWFRQFVEVRDSEGAERCIASAVKAGATDCDLAELFFSAVTDHRYINIGHVADFTNKALEALDVVGWDQAGPILSSLVQNYTNASRQEESNAWRHPIDLVELLDAAFEQIPAAQQAGHGKMWQPIQAPFVETLLSDDPQAIVDALLDALRHGATGEALAATVAYAAIRRMAHSHTSNEYTDWDTVLHTLSYANAIHQGIRRVGEPVSPELLRGVFDAAMSVYLDRFLNIPSAPLPKPSADSATPDEILGGYLTLLDHQQEVEAAAELVARYMATGADPAKLIAVMGQGLTREDRDFHTIQSLEAAIKQYERWRGDPQTAPAATHALIATARYMAAHAPTSRSDTQTFRIARRLHRGEKVFEG